MFKRLKHKRFAQIFEYLDEAQLGIIDVVGLVRSPTTHMDNLDNEVRSRQAGRRLCALPYQMRRCISSVAC